MMVKGQRYCLTRMGFGLNVAPSIMQVIVETVLSNDVTIQQATSAYIDNIFINSSVALAERVKQHLRFGLESKDPERLEDGARVHGLEVWGERGTLRWKHGSVIPDVPEVVTRRTVFFFSARETARASASVRVAPSGNGNDKAKGQRRDPRMGLLHRGCPSTTNGPGNDSQSDTERSFAGPMVRDWSRHQCVGRRKFPGDRRAPGTR